MAMVDGTRQGEWLQAALVDDPTFLRGIVERTLQAILEEEMTAHTLCLQLNRLLGVADWLCIKRLAFN
jgi:hypothetical protein